MLHNVGITITLLFIFITSTVYPKDREAGAYERKSVSLMDGLMLADRSARQIPKKYRKVILNSVTNAVKLERFDYNELPDTLTTNFIRTINSIDTPIFDSVPSLINRFLIGDILKILNDVKKSRAEKLLTAQQSNSFITDKAKESGITVEELNAVMNSAYIFIPILGNVKRVHIKKDTVYRVSATVGVSWWHVIVSDSSIRAENIDTRFFSARGSSKIGKNYLYGGRVIGYKMRALLSMLDKITMHIHTATKEIDEFTLTTQVESHNFLSMEIPIGTASGVHVDDKYLLMEKSELGDGSVLKKKAGWIRIRRVGLKGNSNKSKASIVAGSPNIGTELKELPRLPIDIDISLVHVPVSVVDENVGTHIKNLKLWNTKGVALKLNGTLGPATQIPLLFLSLNGYVGFGRASGSVENSISTIQKLENYTGYGFGLSLMKKTYIRRFGMYLDLHLDWHYVHILGKDFTNYSGEIYSNYWYNYSLGFVPEVGLEVALSPAFTLRSGIAYSLIPNSSIWKYREKKDTDKSWSNGLSGTIEPILNYKGFVISAGMVLSLPSIPDMPLFTTKTE